MTSALPARNRSPLFAALLFGCWAAAIAVAPSLTVKALLAAPAAIAGTVWWTIQRPGRWVALFFAAALLLPPLPIPIGNSGPHPSMIFAVLGIFCGVLWLSEWRVPASNLNGAFVVILGVLLSSVAMAALHSGAPAAAGSFARVALFGISVFVFFYTAYGPGRDARASCVALYWIAAVSALFACVDFYFQFPAPAGYGPQFVWLDSGIYRRAQGLFYEAGTLGNFCAFFLVMIAVAFSTPRAEAPVSRKALLAGGAIFFAALVLSYSRSSLINLGIACLVLVWLNRKRIALARIAPVLAACVIAAAFLTWKVFPAFAEMYWLRLSASAEFFFSATEGVLSGRVESWRTLTSWISANPWQAFFGIGYKTLPYSDYLGASIVADNMYLSLLVETGIAGLAALLWLNVAIVRAATRAVRSADPRASFYGAWILCFWCGQTVQMFSADVLTFWRVLPIYFWVLALAVRR
jgi:O-antigen ligase